MPNFKKEYLEDLVNYANLRWKYQKYLYLFFKYKSSQDIRIPVTLTHRAKEKMFQKLHFLHDRQDDDSDPNDQFDIDSYFNCPPKENRRQALRNIRRHSRDIFQNLVRYSSSEDEMADEESGVDQVKLNFLLYNKNRRFVSYPKREFKENMAEV